MFIFTHKWLPQLLSALVVCLGFFSYGILPSWTSPVLPKLKANDSSIPVTETEASWIVSVVGLGGIMAPVAGILSDRLGRKPMLLFTTIPLITHWILILLATSANYILAARVLAGVGVASLYVVGPVYMGEVAHQEIRGILGAMMDLFYNCGALFSYCVGPYTSFSLFNGLCCVFPLLTLVCALFLPETPYSLFKRNKTDYALLALMRLRNDTAQNVMEEMNKIGESVAEQTKTEGTVRELFLNRASRRGLLVTVLLIIVQQFSGMMAIEAYNEQIFDQSPGISLSSSECAIVVGVIQIAAGSISVTLVDKVGRRPLLMISTLGCGIFHAILGTYFYFHVNKYKMVGFEWLPLTCLVLFVTFFCLGLSPLPVLMLGEVFPSNVKDLAVSIGVFTTSMSFLVVTKVFQIMTDSIGTYSPFWLFSAVTALGFLFVFFVVPETRGRRFETIIADLNRRDRS